MARKNVRHGEETGLTGIFAAVRLAEDMNGVEGFLIQTNTAIAKAQKEATTK